MAELPQPPRRVQFTSIFDRDKAIAIWITVAVVVALIVGALIHTLAYQRLVEHGKTIEIKSYDRQVHHGRSTSYTASFQIPGEISGQTFDDTVDYDVYTAPYDAPLLVTVDPDNLPHHVVGQATADQLGAYRVDWLAGILIALAIGVASYFGVVGTAKNQFIALEGWGYASARVLNVNVYRGKSASTAITVEIANIENPVRKVVVNAVMYVNTEAPIDVLYDPAFGTTAVKLLEKLQYVEVVGA